MIPARSIALYLSLLFPLAAQSLAPKWNDGQLVATALNVRFLEGKALDRLKNGQSVAFDFQLQLLDGQKTLARSLERFVLSYDLWEETYSAVQLSQASPRTPVYSTTRLKSDAVANWCLGRMKLRLNEADKQKPLTLQLEIRSTGAKIANPLRPQGTVDLGVLVEIFSRPPDPKEARFTAQSQPFTLGSLATP
ncbi:hypothetical protein [Bryobacter aggregatus]|uniref:hypothetical protein n=1 Tax=Bryobacter aggregatus TaxID=360054 RepID=UPI0004E152AE|nr:hypothetical protein [Bryobacter aggregatus]